MRLKRYGWLFLGGMVGASGAMAGEIAPDLSARLESAKPNDRIRVIVTMADRLDPEGYRGRPSGELVSALRRHAASSQGQLRAAIADWGVAGLKSLWIVNGLAAEVPARMIAALAHRPDVARVRLDAETTLPPSDTSTAPPTWNLTAIRADALWGEGLDGTGAVVASLDSGADLSHPDLQSRWRGGNNSWYDPYGEHASPADGHGHGTQTLGIMVGGDAGGTAIGVAPGAQWIAAKIFNNADTAWLSAIHLSFQWVLDPDGDPAVDDAPDVVVGAWGLLDAIGGCDPEFETDIQILKAANVAVAFSAGNSGPGYDSSVSPANYSDSYAIGAVDENLRLADFSARGPSACDGELYPHLVAPGVDIRTTDLSFGGLNPDPYITVSGTSFSVAHMGGAMALLRAAVPGADVAEIESALNGSAVDLGHAGADNSYGWGLLDVAAAHHRLAQSEAGGEEPPAEEPPAEEPPPDGGTEPVDDADGDGFDVVAGDCNDDDPAIHPGAVEVKFDGIDQDCNGYDLTIAITRALYTVRRDMLEVSATTALGEQADLVAAGFGPMRWNATAGAWELRVRDVGGDPGSVTVVGIEGSESASIERR